MMKYEEVLVRLHEANEKLATARMDAYEECAKIAESVGYNDGGAAAWEIRQAAREFAFE